MYANIIYENIEVYNMKNKFNKKFWVISTLITVVTAFIIGYAPINASNQPSAPVQTAVKSTAVTPGVVIKTSPLEIVASPKQYLNKVVKFRATFDKFSALGLDYKPAYKSSQDYIGILIKRDDVKDHTVPLAEMKMFLTRKEAEKYVDLSSGDIVEIEGKVFSVALGDPWIEIQKFVIINQGAKKATK